MDNAFCRPWVIPLSLVAAYMLTIIPLPTWAIAFRPDWAAMALIYWTMALPNRFGVGAGWITGLFMDVLTGTLLGQHAMAFAILAYVSIRLHQRIRVFPLWQQAITVGAMLAITRLLSLWVDGITGMAPGTWLYWAPLISSMLLWPWLFLLLRQIRRRCHLA
ncbi:MAG: rod shape-determining protein MreD [Acidihalobacter sp.]|jgi:rod shape-determining protein MreD